jgi:hypothetical protein
VGNPLEVCHLGKLLSLQYNIYEPPSLPILLEFPATARPLLASSRLGFIKILNITISLVLVAVVNLSPVFVLLGPCLCFNVNYLCN